MTTLRRALKILSSGAALAVLIAAPNSAAFADELVGNGGFETAGTGGATDSDLWSEFAGGATGTLSQRQNSTVDSGSWAHELFAIGADGLGASAGINQNSITDVGLASLLENTTLSASFRWRGALGPGGVAFGVLRVLNGDGAIVADTMLQALPDTMGAWTSQSLPVLNVPAFGASPNDTYAAFLEISVSAGAFDGSQAQGFVDGVSITGTAVPEPASAALLGLGCATMLIRRRR